MKQRKRILHIENNVQDRDSVLKLFDPNKSLCSEVFHFGSVDASSGESAGVEVYLRFIEEHRDSTDFIILDLGLSMSEEKAIAEWYAAVPPDCEELFARSTGLRLLEGILRDKAFPPERIAIYTQFSPGDDLFKNLTNIGKLLWDGVVIPYFYKGDFHDRLALKEYVESHCGVSMMWVYYSSSDREVRNWIELTIKQLNTMSDTELVLGHGEDDLSGAPERYTELYKERGFLMALIDIIQRREDVDLIAEVREKEEWTDMRKLSAIPLIQKIGQIGGHRTHIIALAKGVFRPGMVRMLLDPHIGVDQVLDLEAPEVSSLSRTLALLRRSATKLQ